MIDFILRYSSLVMEISRLLSIRYNPSNGSFDSPHGKSLVNAVRFHNAGQYVQRDLELLKLEFLVNDLRRIENHSPSVLKEYRKQIRRAGSEDSFFGFRFEVKIGASLIQKGVPFTRPDPPDFVIEDTGIVIECGSARTSDSNKQSDLTYKVGAAVRKKKKKAYAGPDTALFIDITNVRYKSPGMDDKRLREAALKAVESTPFGNVTLFLFLFNGDRGTIETGYIRADNSNISESLLSFMDSHYPVGNHYVKNLWIYPEG